MDENTRHITHLQNSVCWLTGMRKLYLDLDCLSIENKTIL